MDIDISEKVFNNLLFEIERVIESQLEYDIHIAKTSMGWKPTFQAHEGLFISLSDLQEFFMENSDRYIIIDGYEREYNWEEFVDRVVEFGKSTDKGIEKLEKYGTHWVDSKGYIFTFNEFC